MLTISEIRVDLYDVNILGVSWESSMDQGDVASDYIIDLYRSEVQTENFEHVSRLPISGSLFRDGNVNTANTNRTYFYKIIVSLAADNSFLNESDVAFMSGDPNCISLEVVRKERLLLKQYVGHKCMLMQKATEGARCTECWDETMSRVTKRNCTTCGGTGFMLSFYNPIPILVDFTIPGKTENSVEFGVMQDNNSSAWTSNFPVIKVGDYIRELSYGRMWMVESVNYVGLRGFNIKQLISLTREDSGSNVNGLFKDFVYSDPWECDEVKPN